MRSEKPVVVLTTIHSSTHPVLRNIIVSCRQNEMRLIVIGDSKTPRDYEPGTCEFYDLDAQQKLPYSLAPMLRQNHYGRKNIGFLLAMNKGAKQIIELDDDNEPLDNFWQPREINQKGLKFEQSWINVYRYFEGGDSWPRGFALKRIQEPFVSGKFTESVSCPIQQGLSQGDPDLDAIFRLAENKTIHFSDKPPAILGKLAVCPFNSQNTRWFESAFILMYLPTTCSMRLCDIWRGYVGQRIIKENGLHLSFHAPDVVQIRNRHDLKADMMEEIPAYLHTEKLVQGLSELSLKKGETNMPGNLLRCYEYLVREGLVEKQEITLLEAWINDVIQLKKLMAFS